MKDVIKIVKKKCKSGNINANDVEIYINGKILNHVLGFKMHLEAERDLYLIIEVNKNSEESTITDLIINSDKLNVKKRRNPAELIVNSLSGYESYKINLKYVDFLIIDEGIFLDELPRFEESV